MTHYEFNALRKAAGVGLEAFLDADGVHGSYGNVTFRVRVTKAGKYHYAITRADGCRIGGIVEGNAGGLEALRQIIADQARP